MVYWKVLYTPPEVTIYCRIDGYTVLISLFFRHLELRRDECTEGLQSKKQGIYYRTIICRFIVIIYNYLLPDLWDLFMTYQTFSIYIEMNIAILIKRIMIEVLVKYYSRWCKYEFVPSKNTQRYIKAIYISPLCSYDARTFFWEKRR